MAKPPCEPIKVTARLLDGRINSVDGLLFLDAILYHAWYVSHAPDVLTGTAADNPQYVGLPLRQLPGNRWAASCGFYRQYEEGIEYWNKRPNYVGTDAEYLDAHGKMSTGEGQLRAYRMPNVIRLVGDVTFYAVGRPEVVRLYLRNIPALGKKPAEGWGAVADWIVEPWHADWSTLDDAGRLMRPVPIDDIPAGTDRDSYVLRNCGIRPPYWKPCNQTLCAVPKVVQE